MPDLTRYLIDSQNEAGSKHRHGHGDRRRPGGTHQYRLPQTIIGRGQASNHHCRNTIRLRTIRELAAILKAGI
jgi:hypothetical protein